MKIGYPIAFGGMTTAMQHSTVLGLLQESRHESEAAKLLIRDGIPGVVQVPWRISDVAWP